MAYPKSCKGVTLLELLIVVALIAIVSAISIPSFTKTLERNRLKEAAEALRADMQLARKQAIKQSQDVIISRKTGNDGNWCYGFDTVACDCEEDDEASASFCTLKRVRGVNFSDTNLLSHSGNTTFDFRRGTANSGNTCLSTSSFKVKVITNNVGKIEICSDSTASLGGYEACSSNC